MTRQASVHTVIRPIQTRAIHQGNPPPVGRGGPIGVACVGVATTPVIVAAVLTQADPAAIRLPLLLVCSAGYGLALAWAGVRVAAGAAEGRLPELCQVALQSTL